MQQVRLPEPIGPQLFPRAHTITAELSICRNGAEGVVACAGAFSAGWSLYIKDQKPVFRYTYFDVAAVTIPGTERLSEGKVVVKTEFIPDGNQAGEGIVKVL